MEATLSDLRSNMVRRDGDQSPTTGGGRSGRATSERGRTTEGTTAETATLDKGQEAKAAGGRAEYQPLHQVLRDLNLSEIADFVAGDKILKIKQW